MQLSQYEALFAFAIFHRAHAIGTDKVSLWQHPSVCEAVESTMCYRWCCAYHKVKVLSLRLLYKPKVTKNPPYINVFIKVVFVYVFPSGLVASGLVFLFESKKNIPAMGRLLFAHNNYIQICYMQVLLPPKSCLSTECTITHWTRHRKGKREDQNSTTGFTTDLPDAPGQDCTFLSHLCMS